MAIKLSPKKLLNKQFQVDFKGYNPTEVDAFLDQVKDDYEEFAAMLNESYEKIESLESNNSALKMEVENLKRELEIVEEQQSQREENLVQNVDLLKRISNLEKEVYKNK